MKINIAILGSTGSIGENILDIVRKDKKNLKVVLLTANKNYKKLIQQANEYKVKNILIYNDKYYEFLKIKLKGRKINIFSRKTKLNINPGSIEILLNSLGNNLTKIKKEIEKLEIILPEGTLITPEIIEKHIGFSKDFNNFELYKALGERKFKKCFQICKYISENSKSSSLLMTIGGMHTFFKRLMIYKAIENKSKAPEIMGINPFFVKDYYYASKHYSMKQISKIFHYILEADLKSKGVGARSTEPRFILQDLLVKILAK